MVKKITVNKSGDKEESKPSGNNGFMKSYVDSFDANNLEKSLSLEAFDNENLYYFEETKNKRLVKKHLLTKIRSNSALRKIYNSYLDTNYNNVKIQIWFARIGYQEKRELLPGGFLKFLTKVYDKLEKLEKLEEKEKKNEKFKDFLEVFVAYHKYFNPKSK